MLSEGDSLDVIKAGVIVSVMVTLGGGVSQQYIQHNKGTSTYVKINVS